MRDDADPAPDDYSRTRPASGDFDSFFFAAFRVIMTGSTAWDNRSATRPGAFSAILWSVNFRCATAALLALTVIATTACGSGTTASTATSASYYYYEAGWLPSGFSLVTAAGGGPGASSASYGRIGDQTGEGLTVGSQPTASVARSGLANGSQATIRGQKATLVVLMDSGQDYGHALWWEERPGFAIVVQARDPIDVATLTHIAQDVRPVDATTWHRLTVETDPLAREGRVTADMTHYPLLTGTAGGAEWTLTALVPAGYPLGPEDRRMACAQIDFKGEQGRPNVHRCAGPNWTMIGGVVFVFGEVDPAVQDVNITSATVDFTVATRATDAFPKARFYAAPAPDKACLVHISNPGVGPHFGMGLGQIGPLQNQVGYARCSAAPPGPAPYPLPPGITSSAPPTTVPRSQP